jgi:hypothetical protein
MGRFSCVTTAFTDYRYRLTHWRDYHDGSKDSEPTSNRFIKKVFVKWNWSEKLAICWIWFKRTAPIGFNCVSSKVTMINIWKKKNKKRKNFYSGRRYCITSITVENVNGDRSGCGSRSWHARVIARITGSGSGQQKSTLTIDCIRCHAHSSSGRIIQHLTTTTTTIAQKI